MAPSFLIKTSSGSKGGATSTLRKSLTRAIKDEVRDARSGLLDQPIMVVSGEQDFTKGPSSMVGGKEKTPARKMLAADYKA